jgi:hypothetical protein
MYRQPTVARYPLRRIEIFAQYFRKLPDEWFSSN